MCDVPKYIVMVDDDPEDILLVKTAIARSGLPVTFLPLNSGEALQDFVKSQLKRSHEDLDNALYLILLDLNMPRMDGRMCLSLLRKTFPMECLPVVIFSTSSADEDITKSYAQGANAHLCKPDDIQELEQLMRTLFNTWLNEK